MRLHCTLVNSGIECDAGAYTQVYEPVRYLKSAFLAHQFGKITGFPQGVERFAPRCEIA